MRSRYLTLATLVLLVLTGQAMAVARGQAGAAGVIELCTGTGPVLVAVDEEGAPVGPPRYCPDQVLGLLAAVALTQPASEMALGVARRNVVVGAAQDGADLTPQRVARAPPSAA